MAAPVYSIEDNILKGITTPCKIQNKQDIGNIILNKLNQYGDRIVQICTDTGDQRACNFITDRIIRCALWLRSQGIGSGDVVTLCSHNQLDGCIPILATFLVGAVYNSLFYDLNIETARHCMKLIKPKIIFSSESAVSFLEKAAELENVPTKIIVFGKHPSYQSFSDIIDEQTSKEVQSFKPQKISNLENLSMILFSSGSTGLPKAAAHSYNWLIEVVANATHELGFVPVTLWYSNYSWISGTVFTIYMLIIGGVSIFHAQFEPEKTLEIVQTYKVSWIYLPCYNLSACIKLSLFDKYELKTLTIVSTGSTIVHPDHFNMLKKKLPHAVIANLYGLTEIGGQFGDYHHKTKGQSIGFISPNSQLKIVDLTRNIALGPNEQGEMCIKMTTVMKGYYNNPMTTKEVIDDEGWLHTGDIGYYDENGEMYVLDRIKNLIKRGDTYIPVSEIENNLLTHSGVMSVAIVPIFSDKGNRNLVAFIKKIPEVEVTESELIELSAALGEDVTITAVTFLDKIPFTVTGKIARNELTELAKNKYADLIKRE